MGLINIIKPLSTVLRSAINKSQQHQEKNSWNVQNWTRGCCVGSKKCQACTMQLPRLARSLKRTQELQGQVPELRPSWWAAGSPSTSGWRWCPIRLSSPRRRERFRSGSATHAPGKKSLRVVGNFRQLAILTKKYQAKPCWKNQKLFDWEVKQQPSGRHKKAQLEKPLLSSIIGLRGVLEARRNCQGEHTSGQSALV